MQYDGDLTITNENISNFPDLQRVAGNLTIDSPDINLPILQWIGGVLMVNSKAHNFRADELTIVEGDAFLYGSHGRYTNLEVVKGFLHTSIYNYLPNFPTKEMHTLY